MGNYKLLFSERHLRFVCVEMIFRNESKFVSAPAAQCAMNCIVRPGVGAELHTDDNCR